MATEVDYRSGWKSDWAVAYGLSEHGCMLHSARGFVESGDMILLRFTDRVAVEAKVIWQQNRTAGIEFAEPVHPLIVAHLSFRDAKAEPAGSGTPHPTRGGDRARHLRRIGQEEAEGAE